MKKLLLLIQCCIIVTTALSQNNSAKLSPFTRILLKEIESNGEKFIPSSKYVYKNIGNRIYISAIVKILPVFDEAQFNSYEVIVGTKAGFIRTVQIPYEKFVAFTKLSGVNYIQIDEPVYPTLYQWNEAMQYSSTPGAQGICPAGWHIPTHDQFTTLERSVCTSGSCATDFPYDITTMAKSGRCVC